MCSATGNNQLHIITTLDPQFTNIQFHNYALVSFKWFDLNSNVVCKCETDSFVWCTMSWLPWIRSAFSQSQEEIANSLSIWTVSWRFASNAIFLLAVLSVAQGRITVSPSPKFPKKWFAI